MATGAGSGDATRAALADAATTAGSGTREGTAAQSVEAAVAKERAASQQRVKQVVDAAAEALDRKTAETLEARTNVERAKHLADTAFNQALDAAAANAKLHEGGQKLQSQLTDMTLKVETLQVAVDTASGRIKVLEDQLSNTMADSITKEAIIASMRVAADAEVDKTNFARWLRS